MSVSDVFQRLVPSQHTGFIIASSVASTLALLTVVRLAFQSTPQHIIPSPRATQLPRLSKAEQDKLAYPPDVFPGRDVTSPYGTIRVFEWGPPTGRKVLLIHGISTPCLSLGAIASLLASRGCRVMLIDLWGRGYSDSPDLPHDSRLYATEILLAITSSPLAWTPEGFSLIGYSLGGGIAAEFAAFFPEMVRAVVLLAPSGLIRKEKFGWGSKVMYSGLFPESVLRWVVRRRLRAPVQSAPVEASDTVSAEDVVNEEIKGTRDPVFEAAPLSKTRPDVTVASAVQWQLENHEGFVHSFISSIKYSPISERNDVWRKLGDRSDKVVIIAGSSDPLIIPAELEIDSKEAIGAEKVDFLTVVGGHDFPIRSAEEVTQLISGIWGL